MKKISIYILIIVVMIVFSGCNVLGLEQTGQPPNNNEINNSSNNVTNYTDNEEINNIQNENNNIDNDTSNQIINNNNNIDENNIVNNEDVNNENENNNTNQNNAENQETEVTDLLIYYTESDGYLVPVTIKVPKTYQVATESISQMITTSDTKQKAREYGMKPVLPEGTRLLDISIEDKKATLNFSKEILNYNDKFDEYNIIAALVYTMCGFQTVDSVNIYVDGKYPGTLEYGTVINRAFYKKDILINSNSIMADEGRAKYDIYLVKPIDNTEKIIPLSCEFVKANLFDTTVKIITELKRNYESYNLYSQIPSGTEVVEANMSEDGLLEVVLSQNINNYESGSAREIAIVNQLIYSFGEIQGANKVKLTIKDSDDVLKQGYELIEPFSINKYINQVD